MSVRPLTLLSLSLSFQIGIGLIFAITGATAGNLIVFGLPSYFFIVLETRYPLLSREKLPSLLLLIMVRGDMRIVVCGSWSFSDLLQSFVLTVTGLFSAVAFQILGGLDEGLQNAPNQTECGVVWNTTMTQ